MLRTFFNEADNMVTDVVDKGFGFTGWTREILGIILWITIVPLAAILVLAYPIVMFLRSIFRRLQ